jgi:hypothetical protein
VDSLPISAPMENALQTVAGRHCSIKMIRRQRRVDGIQEDRIPQNLDRQCKATEGIRNDFGLQRALNYMIGEKLFSFVQAAEHAPEFAAELPSFVNEIRRIFTAQEICSYLDDLERSKFLSPPDADEDDDDFEDVIPDNPIRGAQELLRFARIKEMLQAGV